MDDENPAPGSEEASVDGQGQGEVGLLFFDRILESENFFAGGILEAATKGHDVTGGILKQLNQVTAVRAHIIDRAGAHHGCGHIPCNGEFVAQNLLDPHHICLVKVADQ